MNINKSQIKDHFKKLSPTMLVLLSAATVLLVVSIIIAVLSLSCVKIDSCYYSKNQAELDLRGRGLTTVAGIDELESPELIDLRGNELPPEEVLALSERFPECEIIWDVPFGGRTLESTIAEITLTDGDAASLDSLRCFSSLDVIDARGLDYETVARVNELCPDASLIWDVSIGSQRYSSDIREITIDADVPAADLEKLPMLSSLERIDASECREYDALLRLAERIPEVELIYTVTIGGVTIDNKARELDLSGRRIRDIEALDHDLILLDYLTESLSIDMCGCGVPNEQMAVWRDRYPLHKFIWEITFGNKIKSWTVRTDIKVFSTTLRADQDDHGTEWMYRDLFLYCTDLVALDLGHNNLKDISLIANLKKLQGLILTDNHITDLSPLAELPELVYLEANKNSFTDISCLAACKKLEHVDVYFNRIKSIKALAACTSLKTLIIADSLVSDKQIEALQKSLPDCAIVKYLDDSGRKARNSKIRSEFRLALVNYELVVDFPDWQNVVYKEGAELSYPLGYKK